MDSTGNDFIPTIKVIGVGGCGASLMRSLIGAHHHAIQFILASTDVKTIKASQADVNIQLGKTTTKGLGAGAIPEMGKKAAQESMAEIESAIAGADMLILTAGMGGGTGTLAAAEIAKCARSLDILTLAFVTTPFRLEGGKRAKYAAEGIAQLEQSAHSMIVVANEMLFSVLGPQTYFRDAIEACNEILRKAISGLLVTMTRSGFINIDFADVKLIFSQRGKAIIGHGSGRGQNAIEEATQQAFENPLIDVKNIADAKGVLISVIANDTFDISQLEHVGKCVQRIINPESEVIVGLVIDKTVQDRIELMLIATGIC
jgi:cell division protein FtsZ